MSSASETHSINNTLACVIRMCVGKVTTVELRNDAYATGRVVEVDGFMNVVMKEVEFYDAMRNRSKLDSFFVQNRLIRFVQIPTEIDIKSSMQELFNPNQRGRGRGRGKGPEFRVSGGRYKILKAREKRRQEDLENAQKFIQEQAQNQGTSQSSTNK